MTVDRSPFSLPAPFVADRDFVLYVGDVRDVLRTLEPTCIDCCVTSPPYWGLRDYGHEDQIGLEATPEEYVAAMVATFAEVRRVLKDDGTLWLNLGDTYAGNRSYQVPDTKGRKGGVGNTRAMTVSRRRDDAEIPRSDLAVASAKPKDLLGIPWRVALALQADGWYLRCDVVWHKPNPMPESVTDRPTRAHEYVFLLSKSPRYFYDHEAIAEPATWYGPNGQPKEGPHAGQMKGRAGKQAQIASQQVRGGDRTTGFNERWADSTRTQTRRAVELAEQHGLTDAHIDAIRRVGIGDVGKASELRESGSWGGYAHDDETLRLVGEAKEALGGYYREFLIPLTRNARSVWSIQTMQYADAHFAVFPEELPRRCILAGCRPGGTVLDPFMGSGTTALVARKLNRSSVGIEIRSAYAELCAARLAQQSLFTESAA